MIGNATVRLNPRFIGLAMAVAFGMTVRCEGTIAIASASRQSQRCNPRRCRILHAGGLGVSPNFKKSPKIGGYRGLIKIISVFSLKENKGRKSGKKEG